MKDARLKYESHKRRAASRGIGFELSFEEWCEIWEKSGKYAQMGTGRGQYVMARNWDAGPYAVWNVDIQTTGENSMTVAYRKRYAKVFSVVSAPAELSEIEL